MICFSFCSSLNFLVYQKATTTTTKRYSSYDDSAVVDPTSPSSFQRVLSTSMESPTWSQVTLARELVAKELDSTAFAEQRKQQQEVTKQTQSKIAEELTQFREQMRYVSWSLSDTTDDALISSPISGKPLALSESRGCFSHISLPPSPYLTRQWSSQRRYEKRGDGAFPSASEMGSDWHTPDRILLESPSQTPESTLNEKRNDYIYHEWLVSQYVSSEQYGKHYSTAEETDLYRCYFQFLQERLFEVCTRTASLKRTRAEYNKQSHEEVQKLKDQIEKKSNTIKALQKMVHTNKRPKSESLLQCIIDD